MEAVLFDLDGTIFDRDKAVVNFIDSQYERFASELQLPDKALYQQAFIQLDNRGYTPKTEVYQELAARFCMKDGAAEVLNDDYTARIADFAVPYDYALETLQLLSEQYRLGIVSNGSASMQQAVIEKLGLYWHCQSLIISEAVGLRKPEKAIYELALAELETTADKTIFVGDNFQNDIAGPQAIGIRGIWFRGKHETVPTFSAWNELPGLLQKL